LATWSGYVGDFILVTSISTCRIVSCMLSHPWSSFGWSGTVGSVPQPMRHAPLVG
jgi:hypothetical protein